MDGCKEDMKKVHGSEMELILFPLPSILIRVCLKYHIRKSKMGERNTSTKETERRSRRIASEERDEELLSLIAIPYMSEMMSCH
jgi:hypothetical protein